jgi:hypothetical protein
VFLDSWGPPHRVDAEGRFEIAGFAPGDTRFTVSADGYAVWLGEGFGVAGGVLELGVIPLARTQPLTLQLVSEQTVDYSQYEGRATGNQYYPIQRFDPTGRIVYPEAGPGHYFIQVTGPDRLEKSLETFLYSGDDWNVQVPVGPGRELLVSISDPSGRPLFERGKLGVRTLKVTSRSPQGIGMGEYGDPDASGRVLFTEIQSNVVSVEALGEGGKRLAFAAFELEGQRTEVDLVVGGPDLWIRVVDPTGFPLGGTTVRLMAPQLETGWIRQVTTDSKGEYRFESLGIEAALVNLSHPTHGFKAGIPVDFEALGAGAPIELELNASTCVRARIMDRQEPLPGVLARIYAAECAFQLGNFASDAQGRLASSAVAEGQYRLIVRQPELWPVDTFVEATEAGLEPVVQVRRLGKLEIHARDNFGTPVKHLPVEIWSEEFGINAAAWIEAGLVDASSSQRLTDSNGRLAVNGLPNGDYRLTLAAPGFAPATVKTHLPPRRTALVPITLR